MKGLLIAFAGEAGAGKDTAASVLVGVHGFVPVALADPLKRMCQDAFLFTDSQLWGESANRNKEDGRYPRGEVDGKMQYLTPRYALQQLGTEWGRKCYPNVWTDYVLRVYNKLQDGDNYYSQTMGLRPCWGVGENLRPKKHVVIADVRFRQEVEELKRAGAFVVRVRRRVVFPGLRGYELEHSSENGLREVDPDLFDDVIDNTESLETFQQAVGVRFRNVWLRRLEDAREEGDRKVSR